MKATIVSPTSKEAENAPRLAHDVGTLLSGIDLERKMPGSPAVRAHSAIVVPCYNESARLRVSGFEKFLDSDQRNSVLIFVAMAAATKRQPCSSASARDMRSGVWSCNRA